MKKTLLLALTICLASSAFAINWQMVGARQAALGGAGVANAQGADAQYYNPALLKDTEEYDEIGTYVTMGAQGKYPESNLINKKFYERYRTKMDADAGVAIRRGSLYFGIRSLSSLFTVPPVGSAKMSAHMGTFTEGSLGYGINLMRGITLGANVKVIEGTMAEYGGAAPNGFGGLMKKLWSKKRFSTNWGVDAGAAIDLSEFFQSNFIFRPTIAIVGKNLNNPKFKMSRAHTPANEKYKLGRQARVGAAIHPFTDRLTITADYDLTKNTTILKGVKSQQLAGGLEFLVINRHTFQLPVRFGVNKDFANLQDPVYLTAGFGTMTADFDFEIAFTSGDCMQKVNAHDMPNALGVAMTLSWLF